MKVKQTTFYAMRILYRIHKEEERTVTSKEIAEKEKISQGVTLKLLRELANAGIVRACQGRGKICGGFLLAKSIDDITMLEIVKIFEGVDVSANLARVPQEKGKLLFQVCEKLNLDLEKLFSEYTIRSLFEAGEQQKSVGEEPEKTNEKLKECSDEQHVRI